MQTPPQGYDHVPADLAPGARKFREYTRIMARLHQAAADWLVYGRPIRPGRLLNVPTVSFQANIAYQGVTQVTMPAVVFSAYRAKDGRISLFAANTDTKAVDFTWTFKPADLGLKQGQKYTVLRHHLRGPLTDPQPPDESIGTFQVMDPGTEISLKGINAQPYDDLDGVVWLELIKK